jgi:hypothetical protein
MASKLSSSTGNYRLLLNGTAVQCYICLTVNVQHLLNDKPNVNDFTLGEVNTFFGGSPTPFSVRCVVPVVAEVQHWVRPRVEYEVEVLNSFTLNICRLNRYITE